MGKFFYLCGVLLVVGLLTASSLMAAAPQLRSLGQLRSCAVDTNGIAVDNAGNLYLLKKNLKTISKFDVYGRKLKHFSPLDVGSGGLAVTPLGDVIFAAADKNVLVLSGDSGNVLRVVGEQEKFTKVVAVAVDGENRLYVADDGAQSLFVYTAEGQLLREFTDVVDDEAVFLDLAINILTGEICIATRDKKTSGIKLNIYDLSGELRRTLSVAELLGKGRILELSAFAFDPLGRLYLFDREQGKIFGVDMRSDGVSSAPVVGMLPVGSEQRAGMVVDPVSCRLFVYGGKKVFIMQVD